MAEVGRQLGHCHGVIAYHLYHSGIQVRPRNYYRGKQDISTDLLAQLYDEGWSLPAIAKKVGLSSQSVHARLYKAGRQMRSISEALKLGHKLGRVKTFGFGPEHPSWKGGRYVTKDGYINISVNGKVYREHRYLWEQACGKLPGEYLIHHLNGIKSDNRLENLIALPKSSHSPRKIIEPFQKRIRELEGKLAQPKLKM